MKSRDGVLVVAKPAGPSSFAVVKTVRRWLRPKKIGHLGTLDPFATGVLPLCLNEATKLAPFLLTADKQYRATIFLGAETDTQDGTGRVLRRSSSLPTVSEITAILPTFLGEQWQTPPNYAAIHYQGQRLYQLARRGILVPPPPRLIRITELVLEAVELPLVTFVLTCSKGTYVRALAAALGERLGCGAFLQALTRLRVGPFSLAQAVELPAAAEEVNPEALWERLVPLAACLPHLPAWQVDAAAARRLRQGQALRFGRELPAAFPGLAGQLWRLVQGEELVALAEVQEAPEGGRLQPRRVFTSARREDQI